MPTSRPFLDALVIVTVGSWILPMSNIGLAAAIPAKPSVTCTFTSDKKKLPSDGYKLFLSPSGALRDIGSHSVRDVDLAKLLRRTDLLSRDKVMYLAIIVAEEDEVSLDVLMRALARIRRNSDPNLWTVIIVWFKKLTVTPSGTYYSSIPNLCSALSPPGVIRGGIFGARTAAPRGVVLTETMSPLNAEIGAGIQG